MRVGFFFVAFLAAGSVWAGAERKPQISVIIDDVGYSLQAGRRVVQLPGPVVCAVLPKTAHATELARLAHAAGKEVMLHLPMQAVEDAPLDGGAVTLDMEREVFEQTVLGNLANLPQVVGVNNHMGSLLTRHPGHMAWLMSLLKPRGLFFIDSRTSAKTVAEDIAREHGVPRLRRHVFLDHDPAPAAVAAEFRRLIALAKTQGYAVAIGHPYPSTLAVLEAELPRLQAAGVELVPVRRLIEQQEDSARPAYSLASPTVVQGSKP